jgi:hypothetical protein
MLSAVDNLSRRDFFASICAEQKVDDDDEEKSPLGR